MVTAMFQSVCVPAIDAYPRYGQLQGAGRHKKSIQMMSGTQGLRLCMGKTSGFRGSAVSVQMMSGIQAPRLCLQNFTGLRGSNAIDSLTRSGQDFHSKVAAVTSVRSRRACHGVPKAMFDRFTEKAIKVIMLSQEESRRLGHNFVGTEQIVLGMIGEGTGIAAKVLKNMGISLKGARIEVEKIIGRGSGFVSVEIPFTPRAKRVLELSLEEARQLGNYRT